MSYVFCQYFSSELNYCLSNFTVFLTFWDLKQLEYPLITLSFWSSWAQALDGLWVVESAVFWFINTCTACLFTLYNKLINIYWVLWVALFHIYKIYKYILGSNWPTIGFLSFFNRKKDPPNYQSPESSLCSLLVGWIFLCGNLLEALGRLNNLSHTCLSSSDLLIRLKNFVSNEIVLLCGKVQIGQYIIISR